MPAALILDTLMDDADADDKTFVLPSNVEEAHPCRPICVLDTGLPRRSTTNVWPSRAALYKGGNLEIVAGKAPLFVTFTPYRNVYKSRRPISQNDQKVGAVETCARHGMA